MRRSRRSRPCSSASLSGFRLNWAPMDLAYAARSCGAAVEPPDGRYLRAGPGDARYRAQQRLDHHAHVVGVGMQQGEGIGQHADVALPEHEVAAFDAFETRIDRDRPAELRLLHVA